MSPRKPKAEPPVLQLTILYRVEVERLNAEDVLDKLRETGSAEIVNATLVPGPI